MATPNLLSLSAVTPTVLVSTQIAVTTDTAVYTVPSAHAVKLSNGTIANVSSAAVTVGVSIVPSGGSADQTHKIIPDTYTVNVGDVLSLTPYIAGAMMGDGDAIAIHAGAASALDVVITGTLMS